MRREHETVSSPFTSVFNNKMAAVLQVHSLKQFLETSSSIHCLEIEKLLEKITKITKDGPQEFQVMCDFDHTLTRYHANGGIGHTSHGVVENSTLLPKSFNEKAKSIHDKYFPIETCHERTLQEKQLAMEEWWSSVHQMIIDYSVKRETLEAMVKESNIRFREGISGLTSLLEKCQVPLTVFSAGLADIIQLAFQVYSYIPDNLLIIGNKMIYNEQGTVTGFQEPLIHSYNKGMTAVKSYPTILNKLKERPNILLIGDSQGDPGMVKGLDNVETIIKIGFLNHKRDTLLPIYEQLYDIVLLGPDENTLNFPITLLETVLNI